jgi:hypothetical protein
LAGYNLLDTVQSFGRDYEDLSYRLSAEKLALQKWAETWVLHQSNRNMDPRHRDYRFAVTTLARISALFAELVEYSDRYGMNCTPEKNDSLLRKICKPFRSLSPRPSRKESSPPSTGSGVNQDLIGLLSNTELLELDEIKPDLEKEVNRLKESAASLQKALPAKSKLRWAVVDREKFGNLIVRLKEYNKILNRVLPVRPESPPKGLLYTLFIVVRAPGLGQTKLKN